MSMNVNMNMNNPYNINQVEQLAIKKLPNPQNYKIVKCKNFESGIYLITKEAVNMETSALLLMENQN